MKKKKSLIQSVVILAALFTLAGAIVAIGKSRSEEITPKRLYREMLTEKAESSGSDQIDLFLQMK